MSTQPINTPDHPIPDLWWKWLLVISLAGGIGGVVLSLGSPLFEGVLGAIYDFVFGPGSAAAISPADRVMFNVAMAVGGGLQAGVCVILFFLALHPIRRGERWAWWAGVLGMGVWFVFDTGVTIGYALNGYPALWPKIVNDLCFIIIYGVPYAALYRRCTH